MNEQWLQEYALLALRINKIMQARTELPYVDGYYGPTEWKLTVDTEPEVPAIDLLKSAIALADALPVPNFEPSRAHTPGKAGCGHGNCLPQTQR